MTRKSNFPFSLPLFRLQHAGQFPLSVKQQLAVETLQLWAPLSFQVCERERERERDGECASVGQRERERERERNSVEMIDEKRVRVCVCVRVHNADLDSHFCGQFIPFFFDIYYFINYFIF